MFTASGDIFSQGDTAIRSQIAQNILGRFSVELHGWHLQYYNHMKREWLDPRISVGRDGKTFSTYLLGQPLAIMPFDKIGSAIAIQERWPYGPTVIWFDRLVGPLFGALEATLFFVFASRLGYGLRRSVLLTLIFGFATTVWPDEQSVLEHTEVAFFLLLAVYFAFRYRDQQRGLQYIVFSSLALGGAAITRYQDAFIAALAISLYLVLPGGRVHGLWLRARDLVLFGFGLVPFAAVDLWYNWYRFTSPFQTGHYEKLFGYPPQRGIPGLLISPGKGIIWYCPVIVLLVFAAPAFWRRFPALFTSFLALSAGLVLLYANVTFWHGDPTWGPRYIFPMIPFLVLPLGQLFMVQSRGRHPLHLLTALVVAVSFTIQLSAVSVSEWRSWYKVISYEENQGYKWSWVASRYRYFWDPHESPLNFQLHGMYQLAYDSWLHRTKYQIVPPVEDPILDRMATDYAVNDWNFWWTTNEFNWWMGQDKVALGMILLLSIMGATGTYVAADVAGWLEPSLQRRDETPIPEAA
ncbi:MAG: hypothetical protein NVS2B16_06360 [Chloroflexota bacterium]